MTLAGDFPSLCLARQERITASSLLTPQGHWRGTALPGAVDTCHSRPPPTS